MGHAIPVRPGQRHDQLRAGHLALSKERFRAGNRAALHLFLRALCADERLCGRAQRPLGQKAHHALLRPVRGGLHAYRAGTVKGRPALALAHVYSKRAKRPDEHGAAARQRCGGHAAGSPGTVPEDQWSALLFAIAGHHSHPGFRHGTARLRGHGLGDRGGPRLVRHRLFDAAVFHPRSRRAPKRKRG